MYSRFSPQFIEACLRSELRAGDHMPCPKCGHPEVAYSNPRRYFPLVGVLGISAAVAFILGQFSLGVGIAIATGFTALTLAGLEPSYTCRHCGRAWRFRDAEKWAKAIRHDHETQP